MRTYAPDDDVKAKQSTTAEAIANLRKGTKQDLLNELIDCRISLSETRKFVAQQNAQHEDRAKRVEELSKWLSSEQSYNQIMQGQITLEQQRSETLLKTIEILIEKVGE